jgi:hypothetical protein
MGDGGNLNAQNVSLELSMWGSSIFHGHSLLSTYKRRGPLLIPFIKEDTTQERHNVARREKSSIHILALSLVLV